MCQLYGSLGRERVCRGDMRGGRRRGRGREDVETKDTLGEFQKGKRAELRSGDRHGVREQVDRGVSRVIAPRGMSRMPTGGKGSAVHCHVGRERDVYFGRSIHRHRRGPLSHCPVSFSSRTSFEHATHHAPPSALSNRGFLATFTLSVRRQERRERGQHWNGERREGAADRHRLPSSLLTLTLSPLLLFPSR